MKKIGLSCGKAVSVFGYERAFEIIKRAGFDAVDFSVEAYPLRGKVYGGSDEELIEHFTAIRKKAEDVGLEISQTHGRCKTYTPDTVESGHADFIAVCEKDIFATSVLGAPACVVHFMNNTRWGKQPSEFMRSTSKEMFERIIPFAERYKTKIALETFGAARISGARIRDFFADPTEFKYQFDSMNTEYKTMCVDTGHTHEVESFWVPPPEEMIKILGKNVTLLHLHDNNSHWDDHLLPGMGNINWPLVFDALDEIEYSGVYNFELAIKFAGCMLEEYLEFIGKYLRKFVDNHGKM